MPTIEQMDKEIRKNVKEAKQESIGRDPKLLEMRAKHFEDLFKYMNRRTTPKKEIVASMHKRSQRWLDKVKAVPIIEKRRRS